MKRRCFQLLRALSVLALLALVAVAVWFPTKYRIAPTMSVPVREFSAAEYPENPAHPSAHCRQYSDRRLTLVAHGRGRFDFAFESPHPHVAKVVFRDIDVALMTPRAPAWTTNDPGNFLIALTDRQWNRQQVNFPAGSPHIEVTGGDGFERTNLFSAELAKNCLNAGLWEVLLFTRENGQKALYYQGWFTFPIGHYKELFEAGNGVSYWRHWHRMEHWINPDGTVVNLPALRSVTAERPVTAQCLADEPVFAGGEQARKMRTTDAKNVRVWKDFLDGRHVEFASFIKPGRYSARHPMKNEFGRIAEFTGAKLREVKSPALATPLHEIELTFRDRKTGEENRLFISGLDLEKIPQLPVADYSKGFYMPMGIGVPPFFQGHQELLDSPPHLSPYFCVLLDAQNRWINHHTLAVDGPVLHRDPVNPRRLHLYLLSYERHTLVGHFILETT